jgi:hypothetical protein
MLGIESKTNVATNPHHGNESLATSAVAVEAGIAAGRESPVTLSDDNLNKQAPKKNISMRLSELRLESNGHEDYKEEEGEEEHNLSWGAMEHAKLAGLCDDEYV